MRSLNTHQRNNHAGFIATVARQGLPLVLWLLLAVAGGMITGRAAAYPQVTPGGTITLTPTTFVGPSASWVIFNPGGATAIASSGGGNPSYPGPGSWLVSDVVGQVGSQTQIISITVTVPASTPVGAGYQVVYAGPSGPNAAYFDVIAPGPPAAPTNLTATGGSQYVNLTWTAVSGATSYSVYRGTSAGGESTTALVTGLTSASYTDNSVVNGTTYYYIVKAVGTGGASPASNEAHFTPTLVVPAAPTGLTAAPGNAQITLSWVAVNGATSYQIFKGTASGGEGSTAIASSTSPSYTNTGLTNGTTYFYTVKATNGAGSSAASNEASTTPLAVPAAPIGLSAVAGNAQVSLTWGASTGASGYNVKRSTTSGGPYTTVASPASPNATDSSSIVNGTTYYYVVTATNASGESPASSQVSATPTSALPAPNLAAQATSSTQVTLTWTAVSGASSYNLYRGTTPGGESATAYKTGLTQQSQFPSYPDTGVTSGVTYYYKITAVGSSGEGVKSNEAAATPGSAQLAAPLLKAVAGNAQVALTWSTVTGATSYNLYRAVGQGNPYPTLYKTGLTGSTFSDIGLTNGTQYTYYVTATAASGEGVSSNQVVVTPGSAALPAPSLSAQASSSTQVTLTWSLVSGANTYDLYRSTTSGGEGSAPYKTGLMQQGPVPSYSDTGLTSGTTYYYKLVAVGPGGEGAFSNEASATPGTTPLAAPTLKGTTTGTQNTLTWSSVAGAASYNVYRTVGQGNPYPVQYKIGLTGTTFADTGLMSGTQYTYYVTAVATSGEGSQSNQVLLTPGSAALPAPSLSAQASGSTQVTLSWTAVTGATSYDLYRSTMAGGEGSTPYKVGLTQQSQVPNYSDTGLTTGTTYYYKIAPVGPGGEGGLSNEASATPGAVVLPAPTLNAAVDPAHYAVTLSWQAVSGATSYNLYRSPGKNAGIPTLYQLGFAGLSFTDTTVPPPGSATYYVTAVNKDGEGAPSSWLSVQVNGFYLSGQATVAITRGTVGSVNVLATPAANFTGLVNLSVTGLPSGTTAWLYPATFALTPVISPQSSGQPSGGINGVASTGLYLAASSATAPGTYVINISGASGGFTSNMTVSLTVN